MIAILMNELAYWLHSAGRRTLLVTVCLMAAVGGVTMLRPEINLPILTAVLLWISLMAGKESWSATPAEDLVRNRLFSHGSVLSAKLLAAVAVGTVHFLILMPFLVMIFVFWGVPWLVLAQISLILLLGMLTTSGLGFLAAQTLFEEKELSLFLVVISWQVILVLIPVFRPINPFYQIWEAIVYGKLSSTGITGGLGFAIFLFSGNWLILRRKRHGYE